MFPVRCSDGESKNRPSNSRRKLYVPLRYFWICRVVSMFLWSMCRWENILKLTLLGKCSEWMKCWYLFCTWTEYREETRVVRMSNTSKLEVYLLWMSHGMAADYYWLDSLPRSFSSSVILSRASCARMAAMADFDKWFSLSLCLRGTANSGDLFAML